MTTPATRAARQAKILEILAKTRVSSQVQLSELLLDEGFDITQATLSRDLDELGAKKVRPDNGRAYYVVGHVEQTLAEHLSGPREKLRRMLDDRVLSRFGPMFDAERMGGAFCLAAIAVPESDWQRVVEAVNAFPEVAHNYRREHRLNMWFVIATATPAGIEDVASRIEAAVGLPVLRFPKEREFFVGMRLEA